MWHILLDIGAGFIVLGILILLGYETVALVNSHIPFTGNLPLITAIIRPWVMEHKGWALAIAAVIFAAFFWLFFHFFLPR